MGRQRPGRVVSALAEARCPPGQYRRGETREQVFRKRLESNSRGLPPKPLENSFQGLIYGARLSLVVGLTATTSHVVWRHVRRAGRTRTGVLPPPRTGCFAVQYRSNSQLETRNAQLTDCVGRRIADHSGLYSCRRCVTIALSATTS